METDIFLLDVGGVDISLQLWLLPFKVHAQNIWIQTEGINIRPLIHSIGCQTGSKCKGEREAPAKSDIYLRYYIIF